MVKRLAFVCLPLAFLNACAVTPPVGAPYAGALPAAPLPRYVPGDQFYYSDGHWELVTKVEGDLVLWLDDLGTSWTTNRDPTTPVLSRKNPAFNDTVEGQSKPGELWPLERGRSDAYAVKHEIIDLKTGRSDTFHDRRACHVDGVEKLSGEVGETVAYRLVCDRSDFGRWRERKTLWYAPSVGHVVRLKNRFVKDDGYEAELLAVSFSFDALPAAARDQAEQALQNSLETIPRGTKQGWMAQDGQNGVEVTPLRSFMSRSHQYCRQANIRLIAQGWTRQGNSVWCRGTDGAWHAVPPRSRAQVEGNAS